MKNVIFLSPPAAGKGTLSDYLVTKFGYQHISTGDLLRNKAKEDEEIAKVLSSGKLIDDDLLLAILKEKLESIDSNVPFILDGVPRTLHQVQVLDIILNGLEGLTDYVVVYIDVLEEILFSRVSGRRICSKCHKTYNQEIEGFKPKVDGVCDSCSSPLIARSDDNLESYQIRYQSYLDSTHPLIDFYKEKGCLKVISNNEVDQTGVFSLLEEAIRD